MRDRKPGPRTILPRLRGADGAERQPVLEMRAADLAGLSVLRHLRGPAVTVQSVHSARTVNPGFAQIASPLSSIGQLAYDMPGPLTFG